VGKRLLITSAIQRKSRKLVKTIASITLEDGTPVAEGTGTHFIVDVVESNVVKE
jgi:predicted thioesterase